MELHNRTQVKAGYTLAAEPNGRELLVVVAKATYAFPGDPSQSPELAPEQVDPVEADVLEGPPGREVTLYETDFAARKPLCDVILNGSAHAPRGVKAERVTVALRVGTMTKSFDVVGHRVWRNGPLRLVPSAPEPFLRMPIGYHNAFGGVDESRPELPSWYATNHAGVGYHEVLAPEHTEGHPLPNTEETGVPIALPNGHYRPMAFGAVGRAWQPRPLRAGTYDQRWLDTRAPFLPADFDDRYYQAAAEDQQIPHLAGAERVTLLNLTPEGTTRFTLPSRRLPISFRRRDGSTEIVQPILDTVIIEPDRQRLLLTWRASLALRRNIHEIQHVVVGQALHPAENPALPKRRFSSLSELAAWQIASRRTGG